MGMMDKLPGMGNLSSAMKERVNDGAIDKMLVIINSMTPLERRRPSVINGSRKRRITQGSGTTLPELNKLLKQHEMMQKMMGKVSKGGFSNMIKGMKGKLPAGFEGLF
jgi:signal recognition particle subunit SRP54